MGGKEQSISELLGKNLVGENALTKDEIDFIHSKVCKIAAVYNDSGNKQIEVQGRIRAKKIDVLVLQLGIPEGTVIFLGIGENENATRDFMRRFVNMLLNEGFTPTFKSNSDAAFAFDREYSRGMQTDKETLKSVLQMIFKDAWSRRVISF